MLYAINFLCNLYPINDLLHFFIKNSAEIKINKINLIDNNIGICQKF